MPLEMWQDEDLLDRSCLGENSGGLGRGPQVAVFKFGHSEFRKRGTIYPEDPVVPSQVR